MPVSCCVVWMQLKEFVDQYESSSWGDLEINYSCVEERYSSCEERLLGAGWRQWWPCGSARRTAARCPRVRVASPQPPPRVELRAARWPLRRRRAVARELGAPPRRRCGAAQTLATRCRVRRRVRAAPAGRRARRPSGQRPVGCRAPRAARASASGSVRSRSPSGSGWRARGTRREARWRRRSRRTRRRMAACRAAARRECRACRTAGAAPWRARDAPAAPFPTGTYWRRPPRGRRRVRRARRQRVGAARTGDSCGGQRGRRGGRRRTRPPTSLARTRTCSPSPRTPPLVLVRLVVDQLGARRHVDARRHARVGVGSAGECALPLPTLPLQPRAPMLFNCLFEWQNF